MGGGYWAAANVAVSALLYLFDFGTNILTLRTYYFVGHTCRRHSYQGDPACTDTRAYGESFEASLSLMLLAHAFNSIIFWIRLDPGQHPLRLAYFLPLIHLSRLLRLLFWHTSSSLKDLPNTISAETSSLYNVLSAALESTPQLILQFYIAVFFVTIQGYDPSPKFDYSRIPKKLILSLVASVTSITYNGSVSCMWNVPEFITSRRRKAIIGVTAGVHTLAVVAAKCLIVAAFNGKNKNIIPAYILFGVMVNWAHYSGQSASMSESGSRTRRMMRHMHNLALAYVSFLLGPLYVVTKHFPGPNYCHHRMLLISTLLHIFSDLTGLALVLLVSAFAETVFPRITWESPCPKRGSPIDDWRRTYMPCTVLPWAVFSLLLLILLTTLMFAMVERGAKPFNDHFEVSATPKQVLTEIELKGQCLLSQLPPTLPSQQASDSDQKGRHVDKKHIYRHSLSSLTYTTELALYKCKDPRIVHTI